MSGPVESKVPKYHRVKDAIAALIADAAPGTAVPTERELADRFQTSRTTVRQALAALNADGRLERTQGRGTFVAEPRRVLVRQLTSYSEDLRNQGHQPTSSVLAVAEVPADPETAERLGLSAGARVHRVERVRKVDGEPLAYETAHLTGPLPGLERELAERGSLYQTLGDVFGVQLARVEDLVETVLAGPYEASLLTVEVGQPMLLIRRTGWDRDDRPVEFTRSIFRGDRFSFIASSTIAAPLDR